MTLRDRVPVQPSLFDAAPSWAHIGDGTPTTGTTAPVPTPSGRDLPMPDPTSPPTDSDAPPPRRFTVEVVRSTRRKRTVGAQLVGGVLRVSLPSWMTRAEEDHWVREMTRRYERAHRTDRIDLVARAASLARRFDLPRPAVVRWGGDMRTQWGSCTPVDRSIRLSNRLAEMPSWVLDYVLVHEMAHLREPNHSDAFWALVRRYDRTERAIGYLLAKSEDPNDTLDPHDVDAHDLDAHGTDAHGTDADN